MEIKIDISKVLRWSAGSCGRSGCTDDSCVCAVCALPIGVDEDDPRWYSHSEYCDGCELCIDDVPIIIFRGEGKEMEQAAFHSACFQTLAVPQ